MQTICDNIQVHETDDIAQNNAPGIVNLGGTDDIIQSEDDTINFDKYNILFNASAVIFPLYFGRPEYPDVIRGPITKHFVYGFIKNFIDVVSAKIWHDPNNDTYHAQKFEHETIRTYVNDYFNDKNMCLLVDYLYLDDDMDITKNRYYTVEIKQTIFITIDFIDYLLMYRSIISNIKNDECANISAYQCIVDYAEYIDSYTQLYIESNEVTDIIFKPALILDYLSDYMRPFYASKDDIYIHMNKIMNKFGCNQNASLDQIIYLKPRYTYTACFKYNKNILGDILDVYASIIETQTNILSD